MANTYKFQIGPRVFQVKAKKDNAKRVEDALKSVEQIRSYHRELSGTFGESESSSTYMTVFGGHQVADPAAYEADKDDFFSSLPGLIAESDIEDVIIQANVVFQKHIPIVDKRKTPEEMAEIRRKNQEYEAKRLAEQKRQDLVAKQAETETPGADLNNLPEDEEGALKTLKTMGITVSHERDWTWVKFPEKPSEKVRNAIWNNGMGAHWSKRRGAWYYTRPVEAAKILAIITRAMA